MVAATELISIYTRYRRTPYFEKNVKRSWSLYRAYLWYAKVELEKVDSKLSDPALVRIAIAKQIVPEVPNYFLLELEPFSASIGLPIENLKVMVVDFILCNACNLTSEDMPYDEFWKVVKL